MMTARSRRWRWPLLLLAYVFLVYLAWGSWLLFPLACFSAAGLLCLLAFL